MSFSTGFKKCKKCGKLLFGLFDGELCDECEKAEQEPTTRQSCENCKILELLVDMELETICEDDDKDFEYCENNCDYKAPTKECYLHWAEHKRKESWNEDRR